MVRTPRLVCSSHIAFSAASRLVCLRSSTRVKVRDRVRVRVRVRPVPAQLHQRLVHEVAAAPPMQELALSRVGGGGAHAGGGRREISVHRVGRLTRRALTAAALSLLLSRAGGLPGRGRRARVDELRRVRTGCLGRRGGADGWDVIHLRRTSERVGARIFRPPLQLPCCPLSLCRLWRNTLPPYPC